MRALRMDLQSLTEEWPYALQPVSSERSSQRVNSATCTKYLSALIPYVQRVNAHCSTLDLNVLAFVAGQHAITLPNKDVRIFHAAFSFFFGFVDKARVTAELKGVEKC